MGALGGIIDSAIGAATGQSGTTLQDFLSHFSSSEGIWIKQIDPLATFDLSFKFYPTMELDTSSGGSEWYEKLGANLASAGMKAVKNAANNLTGGLLGSIMNNQKEKSIMSLHNKFDTEVKSKSHTFMEYLAAANLLVGKDDWIGENAGQSDAPLELQLGLYCQEITIPQMVTIGGGQKSSSVIGEFPINGLFVQTESNDLTMKMINTHAPIFERIFYPWQREVVLPYWSYESQPYTTATITVDFTKHNDIKYVFVGCRPTKIQMQEANQQAVSGNLTRSITFLFDYMFVNSTLTNCESVADKLLSTGRTLLNGATKMMGA